MRYIIIIRKQFGDLVKNERLHHGLSQNAVAERAQVSLRTVSDIENYKANPTLETLCSLVQYLNISLDSIFLNTTNISDTDIVITQLIHELQNCTEEQRVLALNTLHGLLSGFQKLDNKQI